jgi:hypothetical protein
LARNAHRHPDVGRNGTLARISPHNPGSNSQLAGRRRWQNLIMCREWHDAAHLLQS